ncbi:MAG TPA: polysaccharide biosynthesis/export family protein [Flavisolibacter sp.]|jgi:polysaccharide export outer membrane protein|nr:polysaccharide biosynthesis/export family protein [Flavisolibacter sp.]
MRLFNLLLLLAAFLFSCRSQKGVINNYLQNADTTGVKLVSMPEPLIQKNDLLSIKIYSLSADPRTDLLYNLPETTGAGAGTSANGFLVDDDGNIEYPRVGTLHVEGLTKNALAQIIKERLDTVLKSPSVIVRFLNYRVTVLGEVRAPGSFNIPTERVTVLEALGLAGDITEFGNKNIVRVAREKEGQIEIGYVNLTSQDLFNSPYFRLQQNDVIFVEQNRRKLQLEERQSVAQQIGIATSIITAIALIINIIR